MHLKMVSQSVISGPETGSANMRDGGDREEHRQDRTYFRLPQLEETICTLLLGFVHTPEST